MTRPHALIEKAEEEAEIFFGPTVFCTMLNMSDILACGRHPYFVFVWYILIDRDAL
jgi:hypothetical protein